MRQSFAKPPSQIDYSVAEDLARILLTPIVDPESEIRWIVAHFANGSNVRGAVKLYPVSKPSNIHDVRIGNCDALRLGAAATCARTMSEVNCRQVIEPASHPP